MKTCRPFKDYNNHLKAHEDSDKLKSRGFTNNKENCLFQCKLVKDDKSCGYGFNSKKHYDFHISQHSKTYKCKFESCNKEYSAFEFMGPNQALRLHLKSKDDIESATCECRAWFIDRVDSHNNKFSADDQTA